MRNINERLFGDISLHEQKIEKIHRVIAELSFAVGKGNAMHMLLPFSNGNQTINIELGVFAALEEILTEEYRSTLEDRVVYEGTSDIGDIENFANYGIVD